MKILLPCPGCQHPLLPPRQASHNAQLRCSLCGHTLAADSILVDDSQLAGAWEVVEDTGEDNVFAAFHRSEPSESPTSYSTSDNGHRDAGVVVPPSNEWETQSSSVVLEEPMITEAAYQIASPSHVPEVNSAAENGAAELVEDESESESDEMISVSDEPWFSPLEPAPLWMDEDDDSQASGRMLVPVATEFLGEVEDDSYNESEDDSKPLLVEGFLDDDEDERAFQPVEFVPRSNQSFQNATPILPNELLNNSSTVLRARKKSNPVGTLLSVMGGGMAAIPISLLLMWYALGKDPLEAGPMVANVAPWIVPPKFRGNVGLAEKLPEMPPMVGPGFSDSDPNAMGKLPSIGGMAAAEPTTKPAVESVGNTKVESEISHPSNTIAMTPSTEPLSVPSSATEMTQQPLAPDVSPIAPPSVMSIDGANAGKLEVDTPKIEVALAGLKKATVLFDLTTTESGAILFRALESFGQELAMFPQSSSEHADWRTKGAEACQAIVANRSILGSFAKIIGSSGTESLFPGERVEYRDHQISIDIIQVEKTEEGSSDDRWMIQQRRQKSLELRPVVVSHELGLKSEANNVFLVIGESEVDPESRQLIVRGLMAVPIPPSPSPK